MRQIFFHLLPKKFDLLKQNLRYFPIHFIWVTFNPSSTTYRYTQEMSFLDALSGNRTLNWTYIMSRSTHIPSANQVTKAAINLELYFQKRHHHSIFNTIVVYFASPALFSCAFHFSSPKNILLKFRNVINSNMWRFFFVKHFFFVF